jgi:hypothetical protein
VTKTRLRVTGYHERLGENCGLRVVKLLDLLVVGRLAAAPSGLIHCGSINMEWGNDQWSHRSDCANVWVFAASTPCQCTTHRFELTRQSLAVRQRVQRQDWMSA